MNKFKVGDKVRCKAGISGNGYGWAPDAHEAVVKRYVGVITERVGISWLVKFPNTSHHSWTENRIEPAVSRKTIIIRA